jgi:predicted ferric reductase
MRYTYSKGVLWLLIYLTLTILPLLIGAIGYTPAYRSFWIEFGVAMGFIALGMFAAQFLFSGRFSKIAPSFGMDNIIQYHREVGIIAFVFVLIHPLVLLLSEREFVSYFDPGVNAPRTIALITVILAAILLIATSLWRLSFSLDYEKWRLLHGLLSLAIVFIGLVHSIQVSHYLDSLWKKVALSVLMASSMYLVIHTRLIRPWLLKKKPYKVIDVKPERDNCYTLTLAPINQRKMRFKAGQFAWITIGNTPFSLQQHPFSFASSARDPHISFTAKELGDFTSTWKSIKVGTRAFLEGPFGSFTPEPDSHLFLVMGGIGITPAMSMLRTMRDDKDPRKAILVYGNRNWEDITFREELEAISKEIDLKIIHVLSEPDENWKGENGFVNQDLLEKYLPEEPLKFMYFICGPTPLMDITEVSLRNLGIDWRRIYTERFEIV